MKKCFKCGIEKEKSFFCKNSKRYDGLQVYCNECHKKIKYEYESQENIKLKRSVRKRKYRQTEKWKIKASIDFAKRRSSKINPIYGHALTEKEWVSILEIFDNKCCYCQMEKKMTIDHVWPIKLGGETAFYNCVPACQSCNSSKNSKLLHLEWTPINFNLSAFSIWHQTYWGWGHQRLKNDELHFWSKV